MHKFFVGFNSTASEDAHEYLTEPRAPRNYGEKAAAEFVSKAKEGQLEKCALSPVVGQVTGLCVKDEHSRILLEVSSTDKVSVSEQFSRWASSLPGGIVMLLGVGIFDLTRIMAIERLRQGDPPLPQWVWRGGSSNSHLCDPYSVLLDAEDRKLVSLPCLLRYLGAKEFDDVYSPSWLAEAAVFLAEKTKLF